MWHVIMSIQEIMASLSEEQAFLTALKAAYTAAISGSEYTISTGGNTRKYSRQNLDELRAEMERCEERIVNIQSGSRGIPIKFGTMNR